MVELSNSHSSVDVLYLNLSSEGLKEDLAKPAADPAYSPVGDLAAIPSIDRD